MLRDYVVNALYLAQVLFSNIYYFFIPPFSLVYIIYFMSRLSKFRYTLSLLLNFFRCYLLNHVNYSSGNVVTKAFKYMLFIDLLLFIAPTTTKVPVTFTAVSMLPLV